MLFRNGWDIATPESVDMVGIHQRIAPKPGNFQLISTRKPSRSIRAGDAAVRF
jgi:hypothetical protein